MQRDNRKRKSRTRLLVGQLKSMVGHRLADQAPESGLHGSGGLRSPDLNKGLDQLPLDYTGPVPPELMTDPFAYDPVPWSIRQAELESHKRMNLIWVASLAVSWAITAVAVLRVLGIL